MPEDAPIDVAKAASRLCAACGMCCDGTLFHDVRLQESDDPKDLLELGMKLKRRKKRYQFAQPCQAFRGSCCSIYKSRPERCRVFECRLLVRLKSGNLPASAAMMHVRAARTKLARVNRLLDHGGHANPKHPLEKRCEKILNELSDRSYEPGTEALRAELVEAIAVLERFLESEFRLAITDLNR